VRSDHRRDFFGDARSAKASRRKPTNCLRRCYAYYYQFRRYAGPPKNEASRFS